MKHPLLPSIKALSFLLLLGLGMHAAQAQRAVGTASATPGVWFLLSNDARLSQRVGLHTDLHWRGAQTASQTPAQNLLRIGLNVHLGKQAIAGGGYAYAYALPLPDQPRSSAAGAHEHRIFQQFQFGEQTGALWTRHRYRVEERWLNRAGTVSAAYRTRLRYQLRLLVPLRRDHRLKPGTAYLVGANELFINLGSAPAFFDQNRASLLLGLQLSGCAALEAGVVNQSFSADSGLDGGVGNVLQVGFAFSPDVRHGRGIKNEE
jgi:hypothetical protein